MDENPPTNLGYTGSFPLPGIFHMPWNNQAQAPQLLSLCAANTEAQRPRAKEAPAMRSSLTTTIESPGVKMKT